MIQNLVKNPVKALPNQRFYNFLAFIFKRKTGKDSMKINELDKSHASNKNMMSSNYDA